MGMGFKFQMGMGMKSLKWEGIGTKKSVPAHLYHRVIVVVVVAAAAEQQQKVLYLPL